MPQMAGSSDRLWPTPTTHDGGTQGASQGSAGPAAGRSSIGEVSLWALNFSVAAISLILLSPLLAVIALAIKLDSPGPVLYRQVRVGLDRRVGSPGGPAGRRAADRGPGPAGFDRASGRAEQRSGSTRRKDDVGGRPFVIYKFRTMDVNAEDQTGPVWAAARDRRTTRLGRLLRRYRLDEIPQFLNVLRGDMAVVGPRPERPAFVRHLRGEIGEYQARQKVKPGITGLAQVRRGADQTVDDVRVKVASDLEYVQRRSLATDLRIMLKTLPVMLWQEHDERDGADGDHVSRQVSS